MLFRFVSGQQRIGNNEKMQANLLAISIAMRMLRHDAGHIA